ncbi:MAG: hypothetical protein WCD18_27400 [Thermosynechococcaceae cyanobacterium]
MWLIWKQVGVFEHYLTPAGHFQPSLEKAWKLSSQTMAEVMVKKYGGHLRELSNDSGNSEQEI